MALQIYFNKTFMLKQCHQSGERERNESESESENETASSALYQT